MDKAIFCAKLAKVEKKSSIFFSILQWQCTSWCSWRLSSSTCWWEGQTSPCCLNVRCHRGPRQRKLYLKKSNRNLYDHVTWAVITICLQLASGTHCVDFLNDLIIAYTLGYCIWVECVKTYILLSAYVKNKKPSVYNAAPQSAVVKLIKHLHNIWNRFQQKLNIITFTKIQFIVLHCIIFSQVHPINWQLSV